MEWTRSETLALAAPACNMCLGLGLRIGRNEATNPCNCVLRAIFRACFEQFRDCGAGKNLSVRSRSTRCRVKIEKAHGDGRMRNISRTFV
jgi:hypothetical protein